MIGRYIQNENCDATELDGEWVILNTNKYTITKLNDVGGHCWSMMKEAQTADTLTQTVVKSLSIRENHTQVKKDIEEFLESLIQCGLIQYAD